VEAGSRLVTDAGQTMREIVAGVAQVSEAIRQISDSTASQSQGIESVNGAIGQLDQVTRENTRRVQDSTAAAQALQHEASHLAEAVDRFRLAAV
jgi:methyl-accepting chemotaxis protein